MTEGKRRGDLTEREQESLDRAASGIADMCTGALAAALPGLSSPENDAVGRADVAFGRAVGTAVELCRLVDDALGLVPGTCAGEASGRFDGLSLAAVRFAAALAGRCPERG